MVFDNRGHGYTSGVGDPKSRRTQKIDFSEMADDMAALLDRLDIAAACVGGQVTTDTEGRGEHESGGVFSLWSSCLV
jgi:hypothetical protein